MRKRNFAVALLFSAAAMAQYRWMEYPGSAEVDPLTKSRIGEAFNVDLGKKGLTQAGSDGADLVLVYHIAVRDEMEITFVDKGWGYGPGWRRGGYGPRSGSTVSTTNTIQIGSLTLEGVQPDKRKRNIGMCCNGGAGLLVAWRDREEETSTGDLQRAADRA